MNQNIWSLSINDFFTKKMLLFAFGPFLATLVAFVIFLSPVYHTLMDSTHSSTIQIETTQTSYSNGDVSSENSHIVYTGESTFLDFLLNNGVVSWIILTFSFFILLMVMFVIAMVVAILIIGFLTPAIMRELQRRHYPEIPLEEHGNIITTLFHSLRYVMIMFLLLFVMIPLYFIPFVNIIAINIPFYYLFHKFYMLDVSTTAMTKEQYKQMMYFDKTKVRGTSLTLFLLSMIPFAALITPVFNVIVLGHTVMRSKQKQLTAPKQS